MIAPTHSIFGLFLALILLAVFGIQESLHWTILLCAVLGSIVPDLDIASSFIGRIFFFITIPLERKFGHRTITHSLLGWFIATIIFAVIVVITGFVIETRLIASLHVIGGTLDIGLLFRWVSAFSIGYLSHLILDMANPRGSQLFYPNPTRDVFFKNRKFQLETGSKGEIIVFLVLALLLIFAFPISKYGVSTSFRWLLATPESAIEEFKTQHTKTYVIFEGTFNQTKEPITGTAEILGVQNKRLIIRLCPLPSPAKAGEGLGVRASSSSLASESGIIYTLSDELTADITAKHVKFKKTKLPIKIDHKLFENQTRDYLLSLIADTDLISGTITLPDGLQIIRNQESSNFVRISQSGNKLTLNFATKQELRSLKLDEQFQVQTRLIASLSKSIDIKINRINNEINNLKHPNDGLTDLGRQVMGDPDKPKREAKIEKLTQDLEELNLEKEGLALKLKSKILVFSGEVWIRRS